MRLVEVRVEPREGAARLVGRIERSGSRKALELYFEVPERFAPMLWPAADAFLPALLLPAMAAGEELELALPVSPRMLRRLQRIQDPLVAWYPALRHVEVKATERRDDPAPRGDAVGAFFSGGVDSFYTLLKHLHGAPATGPRVTHLLFWRGIETRLEESQGLAQAQARVEEVAQAAGLACIPGETNLRTLFPLTWGMYCGAGLAATAHALAGGLAFALIPSSDGYASLVPFGSHPLLDEHWSSERLAVVHDGCEAGRAQKILRLVGRDPLALAQLRVCTQNAGGPRNCGRCPKCVRTMVVLRAAGVLAQARSFPAELPPDFRRLLLADGPDYLKENLEAARGAGDAELVRALEWVERAMRRRAALRALVETLPPQPLLEALRRWRSRWLARAQSRT